MTQDLEQDLSLYGPEQNWEMSKTYINCSVHMIVLSTAATD